MAVLRDEEYIAFLDESSQDRLHIVAGVLIPARWLRPAERRWRAFVQREFGNPSGRVEVKARDLLRGTGIALHAQTVMLASGAPPVSAVGAGRRVYRDALEHIAGIAEVRILTVGLETRYPLATYRLWYWMMYALLVEKRQMPRPRLPMVFIDGEDAAYRNAHDLVAYRFHRSFPRCQPYVGSGNKCFVGGAAHQDSTLHPFIQMADLVASAGRLAIAGNNAPFDGWYAEHLVEPARRRGREIDVSARGVSQLRRRSRHDACGSNWPYARIVT